MKKIYKCIRVIRSAGVLHRETVELDEVDAKRLLSFGDIEEMEQPESLNPELKPDLNDFKVDELKALLDASGIKYKSDDKKATLVALIEAE